jgi:hypothetical protein
LIISMPIACDYKGKGKSRKKSIAKWPYKECELCGITVNPC